MRTQLLLVNLVLTACCLCQPGTTYLRGEVQHNATDRVDDLSVELYDQDHHSLVERAFVSSDGSFEFRRVAMGNYEMRLVDRFGNVIRSEHSNVNSSGSPVAFRITHEPQQAAVDGVVSASQLAHRENRKAMKEYRAAVKSLSHGDVEAAVPHLEKSIAIDPNFAPAHHRLALIYVARHEQAKAIAELQETVKVDPALMVGHSNLALALLQAGRAGDAETEARKALHLDPNYVKAHYVLAISLIRQQKLGKETVLNLRQSAAAFPPAQRLAETLEAQLNSTTK